MDKLLIVLTLLLGACVPTKFFVSKLNTSEVYSQGIGEPLITVSTVGGNAFFINKHYMLTAAHLIKNQQEIRVYTRGPYKPADVVKLVEIDYENDMALLYSYRPYDGHTHKLCTRKIKKWDPVTIYTSNAKYMYWVVLDTRENEYLLNGGAVKGFSGSPVTTYTKYLEDCVIGIILKRDGPGSKQAIAVHPRISKKIWSKIKE